MLKNILTLDGAQVLKNDEQKSIHGGGSKICNSLSNPPPACICTLPGGGCVYVNPGTTCYDGTDPLC